MSNTTSDQYVTFLVREKGDTYQVTYITKAGKDFPNMAFLKLGNLILSQVDLDEPQRPTQRLSDSIAKYCLYGPTLEVS